LVSAGKMISLRSDWEALTGLELGRSDILLLYWWGLVDERWLVVVGLTVGANDVAENVVWRAIADESHDGQVLTTIETDFLASLL
jgi:hypothetical protein